MFTLFRFGFKKEVLWDFPEKVKDLIPGVNSSSDSGSSVHLLIVHFRLYIYHLLWDQGMVLASFCAVLAPFKRISLRKSITGKLKKV